MYNTAYIGAYAAIKVYKGYITNYDVGFTYESDVGPYLEFIMF